MEKSRYKTIENKQRELLSRNNHYVPQMYLKNWSNDGNKIYTYELIVPNENYPIWRKTAIEHTASMQNLYMQNDTETEQDSIERMFNEKYETPAKEPLAKACRGERLSVDDWYAIIEYIGSQLVRTPAFYQRWHEWNVQLIDKETTNILNLLSSGKLNPASPKDESVVNAGKEFIPMKITTSRDEGLNTGAQVEVETVVGKGVWFFEIDHLLNHTLKILHKHKWRIIYCDNDKYWPTSDDPVICLNCYKDGTYDFEEKIGVSASDILFPISPHMVIHTMIGKKLPPREKANDEMFEFIKQIIIAHADSNVYSIVEDAEIQKYRQRTVNLDVYKHNKDAYSGWYDSYIEKESPLLKHDER